MTAELWDQVLGLVDVQITQVEHALELNREVLNWGDADDRQVDEKIQEARSDYSCVRAVLRESFLSVDRRVREREDAIDRISEDLSRLAGRLADDWEAWAWKKMTGDPTVKPGDVQPMEHVENRARQWIEDGHELPADAHHEVLAALVREQLETVTISCKIQYAQLGIVRSLVADLGLSASKLYADYEAEWKKAVKSLAPEVAWAAWLPPLPLNQPLMIILGVAKWTLDVLLVFVKHHRTKRTSLALQLRALVTKNESLLSGTLTQLQELKRQCEVAQPTLSGVLAWGVPEDEFAILETVADDSLLGFTETQQRLDDARARRAELERHLEALQQLCSAAALPT